MDKQKQFDDSAVKRYVKKRVFKWIFSIRPAVGCLRILSLLAYCIFFIFLALLLHDWVHDHGSPGNPVNAHRVVMVHILEYHICNFRVIFEFLTLPCK